MALSKFTKDMVIIQKLDDEPNDVGGLTSAQLKAKFDEGGEAIKDFINETLTTEIDGGLSAVVPKTTTVNGHPLSSNVSITKTDVGLGSVDNTPDSQKPVSAPQKEFIEKTVSDAATGQLPIPLPVASGGTGAKTSQQALANLGAGVRPNMGDNCDFTHPVNQRGIASWPKTGGDIVIFDRWSIQCHESKCSAELTSDGLILSMDAANQGIRQYFPALFLKPGTKYTSSVMVDGELYSAEITPDPVTGKVVQYPNAEFSCAIVYFNDLSVWFPYVDYRIDQRTVAISRCKLEEGEGQTLAYQDQDGKLIVLPQSDMDYATQLLRCQWYQYIGTFVSGPPYFVSSSQLHFIIPAPQHRAIVPSIYNKSGFTVFNSGAQPQSGFDFTMNVNIRTGQYLVIATKEEHGLDRTAYLYVENAGFDMSL